ncbi:MAG: YihY/virulence factor BrkB family protein [Betaproteobacteria bacterium]
MTASWQAWVEHRADSKGAALAFYTLFSMTPILVMAIAVAGNFFGEQAAQGEIIAQVEGLVGPNGAQAIQALLVAARNQDAGLLATIAASVVFLVAATTVFVELKSSLDELWGIDHRARPAPVRSMVGIILQTRLLAFGLVLVLAFLLLISLVVSAGLTMVEHRAAGIWGGSAVVLATVSSMISLGVIACLFAVIYKMLPEAPLSWPDVWIGAVVTSALFSIGKYAIGLYIGGSGVASSFGAAGSIIALLLWVYYSAQIFFFGAEFTRQYALRFGSLRQYRRQLLIEALSAASADKPAASAAAAIREAASSSNAADSERRVR